MSQRGPWKNQPRDTRCDPVIEFYLNTYGADSGVECKDTFPTHDAADDIRLSLRRAGNHYEVSVPAWVTNQAGESCWEDCQDPDAPHITHFRVHSKDHGRAHQMDQGNQPGGIGNWRYNPYLRGQARYEQRRGR
jgi:hypothetical protein